MVGFKDNWKLFIEQGKTCIKELKNKNTRKKQIPNLLTASRLLSPFFIIPTALSGNLLLTSIFTGMFALTDAFDGYFARKYDAFSEFGRKLDPITDKIFAGSLLIPLAFSNPLILINILGEGAIAALSVKAQINGNEPHTIYLGKIKTTSLYITIALSYLSLNFNLSNVFMNSLITITSVLQVCSISKYSSCFKKNIETSSIDLVDNVVVETDNIDNDEKNKQLDPKKISDWYEFKNEILKQKKHTNEKNNNKVKKLKKQNNN